MIDFKARLNLAIVSAIEAGKEIMKVYNSSEMGISEKDDQSPLTLADKKSHEVIIDKLDDEYPILSEEGNAIPYAERKNWKTYWLIDPLDGTKEFIKRNGEFTVNIALIHEGNPVLGVIYVPVTTMLYYSIVEKGAYKNEINSNFDGKSCDDIMKSAIKLPISDAKRNFTLVASRSHMSEETQNFMNELEKEHKMVDTLSVGSSLKLCMIAEGKADVYPRFAPTMEWDTAAGQAIVKGAGKDVFDYSTNAPMKYNKENLLNNWFIAK